MRGGRCCSVQGRNSSIASESICVWPLIAPAFLLLSILDQLCRLPRFSGIITVHLHWE